MTLIAIKDGIFAADRGTFSDSLYRGARDKIVRLPDGSLFAGSGSVPVITAVTEWLASGRLDALKPDAVEEEQFGGLMLGPDGVVCIVDRMMNVYPDYRTYHVEGSHCEFLIGAMAMGASAEQAVNLGCEHCMWARGPIQVETLSIVPDVSFTGVFA